MPAGRTDAELRRRLSRVRWIGGGTGSGKSTVTALLAATFGLDVYDGDRAERAYAARVDPARQPRFAALLAMTPRQRWLNRPPEQVFAEMPSLHGETFGFVLDDILARPGETGLLVDDFRTLPRNVAPLLTWPGQAVFLLPTAGFRKRALGDRYADPARARANWGDEDTAMMLAARLARDELWDAEVRRQARELDLPLLEVDGSRGPADVAEELGRVFRLAGR
jgi:hypothetical protein